MMWLMLGTFLAALAASLLLTPLSIYLSRRLSLLDQPDARKVHTDATPRLGGIGIISGAALIAVPCFLYLYYTSPQLAYTVSRQYLGILLGTACVFAVGVTDDLSPVSSKLKLIALLGASFAACGAGGTFSEIRTDGAVLFQFKWASWTLTAIWIAAFAVSFNFIDGLDGLSGGLGLLTSLVLSVFLLSAGQYAAAIAPLSLAGAILGFLYYNWHPAKTFMGDGGSMAIGFLLGSLTVAANPTLGTMRSMVLPAFAMSVALVDGALTLFRRRYQQRRSMFSAERGHIHHRLLDSGLSHKQAVVAIHGVSVVAVLIGTVSLTFEGWATIGGLSLIVPLLWGLFHIAGSVRTSEMINALRRKHEHDRTFRKFRHAFENLQLEFDAARNFSEWWQVVCNAAERLEFSSIELPLGSETDDVQRNVKWVNPSEISQSDAEQIDAKIPVTIFGDAQPSRIASVRIPASVCLESAGQRLALFSRLMAENGRESLRSIYNTKESSAAMHTTPRHAGEFGHLRVAVVHDFFAAESGCPEKAVEQLINIFPHCDIFALFDFLPAERRAFLKHKPVFTTFVQRLPFARTFPSAYLWLLPLAIEQLDLSAYDIVISSSQLFAKGVITDPKQLHVCYCHSRMRWDLELHRASETRASLGVGNIWTRLTAHYIRNWEANSSHGVDCFIANSRRVARQIEKSFRRSSEIIHPPIDTDTYTPGTSAETAGTTGYYLTAGRLVGCNRIDVIIKGFNQSPERELLVIGEGPEFARLKSMAGSNIKFLGHLDQASITQHIRNAKAVISAAEDDFGSLPVEATSCGVPVIAYRHSGTSESIAEGPMAYFFSELSPKSMLDAMTRHENAGPIDDLDRKAARQNAERFSTTQFVERVTDCIRRELRCRQVRDSAQTSPSNRLAESGSAHPSSQ